MAFLAGCIGIDAYADDTIRDLVGARRDATALWALLKDSIPNIRDTKLVDRDATVSSIRRLLDSTLGGAEPDDTVFISFSGHGTHGYDLVAHDSFHTDPVGSMIPMAEIAQRFKESQARIIFLLLDCCYSGGAPARVLDDSPIPRDAAFPIDATALGKGRYLVTAATIDQRAFEDPTARHGLLTLAVIEAWRAATEPVRLATLIDDVSRRVQADAHRLGYIQSPVLFGHVEDSILLPILKAGEHFARAFPETRGIRIQGGISELTAFGFPPPILDAWSDRFRSGLNPLQVQAVNDHRILDGQSLLVVAPTSAGKTFVGELAAIRAILDGRKAVFLLPYRALVNEKYDQFSDLYGATLGMRVIRCSGDYVDEIDPFMRGKYDLALLTYEMFLQLVLVNPVALHQIGLVVLDEAQFVTDPRRGASVELLLTCLLSAREKGIAPQLITLSAVMGDVNDFDRWLHLPMLISTERPVRLVEGVIDRSGVFQYLADGEVKVEQYMAPVRQRKDKPGAQDVIVPLVRLLMRDTARRREKVIVFRNDRGKAQGCATYLAGELGLEPASEAAAALPTQDPSRTSAALRTCLLGGTAFHTTNLTREQRTVVERSFRDPDGPIRVLAATTTVAAGINTPASTVILAENEFRGEDGRPFTVAEYRNMAGRAGRLGYHEEGKSIIIADNAFERDVLFRRYVMGPLEPLRSSFDQQHPETWIIRLLAQASPIEGEDVPRLVANTYGGYLANRASAGWRDDLRTFVLSLLGEWEALDLLERHGSIVRLTLLGQACGRSALSLDSALLLVRLLQQAAAAPMTAETLMALLQVLPEADATYTPVLKRGAAEDVRRGQAVQRFGRQVAQTLQLHAADGAQWNARCKRAAILADWIAGEPLQDIEMRYTTNAYQGAIAHGHVRAFADATRMYLRSAYEIASLLLVEQAPNADDVDKVLKQLEFGVPGDSLDLLELPFQLARGEHLALCKNGIKTVGQFWQAAPDIVADALGAERAGTVQARRPG